jgi:hypothetical protein
MIGIRRVAPPYEVLLRIVDAREAQIWHAWGTFQQ